MQWKSLIAILFSFLLVFQGVTVVKGNEGPKVLIIISDDNSEMGRVILDQIISHYTSSVMITNDDEVPDLKPFEYVFYVGMVEKTLNDKLVRSLTKFKGSIFFIGHNSKPFHERLKISVSETKVNIKEISFSRGYKKQGFVSLTEIFQIASRGEVLLEGWRGDQSYPLLVFNGQDYYFASTRFDDLFSHYLTECLRHVFKVNKVTSKSIFIRLDSVHPATNLKVFNQLTSYLVSNHIPVVLSISPVFTDDNSGKKLYFSDSPSLVNKIRSLQEKGASVVYAYPKFPEQMAVEEKRSMIEANIQELAVYGIFPVAASISSHLQINEDDLSLIQTYFTTFLASKNKINDYRLEFTPPVMTKPTYLKGTLWIPETLGEIQVSNPTPFLTLKKQLNQLDVVSNATLGLVFPSYLELELLKEFVRRLESVQDKYWIDLQDFKHAVNVPYVNIESQGKGIMAVKNEIPAFRKFMYLYQLSVFEISLWILSIVVALFVIAFMIYSFYLRLQRRKLLFLERKRNGQ